MKCIETALGGGQDVADNVGMAGDTLTELMKQHGHAGRTLNLLKMDIEGSEYNALEYYMNNAQTTKFPDVDLLLMEIHYLNRVRIRELVAKIIEWLEDIGLNIYYSPFQNYRRVPRQKPLCQHLYHIKSVITLCIIFPNWASVIQSFRN